jgi:hypothetical protein
MNHVRMSTDENHSWCGLTLGIDFHFKDAEHAAVNGLHGSLSMCGECIEKIITCLTRTGLCYKEPGIY